MKETKPTTPRLRELEAALATAREEDKVSHLESGLIFNLTGEIQAYRRALKDLWPVIEAARDAAHDLGVHEFARRDKTCGQTLTDALSGVELTDGD